MGCTQSKIENEEIVNRCKERKLFMERAVTARNKFAAAHSATAMSLKNTGAALSDFAQGEVVFAEGGGANPISSNPPSTIAGAIPPPPMPPYDNFLPPPPLPSFPTTPLQRAKTMPDDFKVPRPDDMVKPSGEPPIIEEDEGEDDIESVHSLTRRSFSSKKSGGGGGKKGGVNPTLHIGKDDDHGVEEVEDLALHRRKRGVRNSDNDESHETKPPPPSMPESKGMMSSWDYFFSMENIPGPTLADVEESQAEREETTRKVLDDSRRRDMEEKAKRSSIGEKVTEKEDRAEVENVVAEEHLPQTPSPPQVAMAKVGKRGKQGVTMAEDAKMKKDGGDGGGGLSLVQIFVELDDCFLKASESAHDVSRMLEATRLHYHSNFADKRGNINHSEKVMRVITWNRSFRGLAYPDDGGDDSDSEEHETHAAVLDKMLAWEKKLYDEVKAGEQMKLEYQKKVASLNKLKKRNSNTEALERMKASVSHLHTRYIVDMQSMDSTVSEINRLRDEQLYPKLVALVDGMATMWETMKIHHESKAKIVQSLRSLDTPQTPKETTDHHHERTRQLGGVVQEWHTNFTELMAQQKEYVKTLNAWLKLNLVPIDTNLKEKVSSPTRPANPPMQTLLSAWQDYLERMPDEPAKASINNFGAIVRTIWQYQEEELEFRNRCADSRKDLIRKTRDFENWYNKYAQRRVGTGSDEAGTEDGAHDDRDVIAEKQMVVEAAKHKLEEDEDAYQRQCVQVRDKSLISLKSHLPDLFRALTVFSHDCSDMYHNLRAIAHSGSRNPYL